MLGFWINTIFLLFISLFSFGQKRTWVDSGKVYIIYTSLEEAGLANPDSVIYLELRSKGYIDFPVEILKYKNLEIIDLGTLYFNDVPELLNKKQLNKLERLKKKCNCNEPRSIEFNPNHIKKVPHGICELRKLRHLSLSGVHFKYKLLDDFEKLIPNTKIDPDKETIKIAKEIDQEDMRHKNLWKRFLFKIKPKYY